MAFLGSLGKSLGLSSSFGEGLVTGLASSVDKGIQDDMKRTQDNVDNLVIETYKGAVENKKEFDKMFKDNKKLVENIAANMGGEQGIKHPQALQAAQTLINLKGLDGAFTLAQDYNKAFRMYGKHPTKSLLADETGNSTPITLSALTKSTVTPMSMPDVSELGKSAAVGFMKMDFLGGKDSVGSNISSRAEALIKARGINIDEQTIDLPPALKGKIDPLLLGIKENPVEEKARLLTMMANAERDGTLTPKMEGEMKEMIDITEGITRSMTKNKAMDTATFSSTQSILYKNFHTLNDLDMKTNEYGKYIGSNAKAEQKKIINRSVNYYMNFAAESTLKGNLEDGQSYIQTIIEAMGKNKKLTSTNINGVYKLIVLDGDDSNLVNSDNINILKPKDKKDNLPGNTKNLAVGELGSSTSYIEKYKELKSRYPNLGQSRITPLERDFVKSYMKENKGTTMSEAQQIFRQLIK
tara:strand:+ start:464 stop:1867 length:1404 start_codon:yes stop_codon:yes gene_type:complete